MVISEVLQWSLLVILAVLVMGIFRQLALSLPPAARAVPGAGPALQNRLPRSTLAALSEVFGPFGVVDGTVVVPGQQHTDEQPHDLRS